MKRILGFLVGLLFSLNLAYAQNTWTGALGSGLKPAPSIGKEADWFVDTNTYSFWGPKTSNSWGSSASGTITPALPAGQLPGTATNDSATAGNVGQIISASTSDTGLGRASVSGITVTIATPAVVTWPATNPYAFVGSGCAAVNFTTTGALPTGISVATNYYVIGSSISGNTFQIATTCDNAIAGTAINTTGTQSGTHTGITSAILTSNTVTNVVGISLTAGDWDVYADFGFLTAASTSVTILAGSTSTITAAYVNSPGQAAQYASAAQVPGAVYTIFPVGPKRFSLASPTTIYGVAFPTFTVSTLDGWGGIRARRIR